jgi:hypothetical protein
VFSHRHVLTQQIALTSDNHLEFFSLTSWRRPYTFLALVPSWNHEPFIRGFSQVCKLRVRLHMSTIFHISQVCKLEDVSYSCIHQQFGQEFLTATLLYQNLSSLSFILFHFLLCNFAANVLQPHLVDNKGEALEDLLCLLEYSWSHLWCSFEVLLLQCFLVFPCLHCFTWRAKQIILFWDTLVVVLLLIFVGCFYLGLQSILQVIWKRFTFLFYFVARIYISASYQRLGGVDFRSENSFVQPSKDSFILCFHFRQLIIHFQAFL